MYSGTSSTDAVSLCIGEGVSKGGGGFVKASPFCASFGYFSVRQKSNAHGRCALPRPLRGTQNTDTLRDGAKSNNPASVQRECGAIPGIHLSMG